MFTPTTTTLPQRNPTEDDSSKTARQRSNARSRAPSVAESSVPATRKPGLPAASSEVVHMSPEALRNNERLFPMIQAQLSEDRINGGYASSARKLAGWMSRDKAYYPAARSWIIALLETAQQTLRRTAGNALPQGQPFHVSQCPSILKTQWVDPYTNLVEILRRYEHMFIEPDLRVRLQALLHTIDGPAPSAPRHRMTHGASASGAASPMPHAVPAPRPGSSASIRYATSSPESPMAYHKPPQYTVPPPATDPAPLIVTIPPAMPYRQQVASPAQMSLVEAHPTAVRQPTLPSRRGVNGSISPMSPRPVLAQSNAMPRIVSTPSAVASSPAPAALTPDASVSAPTKRKPKARRELTEDYLLDDMEWFRRQKEMEMEMEMEAQAQSEAKQTTDMSSSAAEPRPTLVEQDHGTTIDEKARASPTDLPGMAGLSPIDQPADAKSGITDQDVHMADATSAVTGTHPPVDAMVADAVSQPPNEILMQAEPQSSLVNDANLRTMENNISAVPVPVDVNAKAPAEPSPVFPMASASASTARVLDLSKLSSSTTSKAKKQPSTDLVYSKVAQPPDPADVTPVSGPSATPAPAAEQYDAPPTSEYWPSVSTSSEASWSIQFSHVVKKSTSKKGPPGIRASELLVQTQDSSMLTGSSDVGPPRTGIKLQSTKGLGLKIKLVPPKPPNPPSAEPLSASSTTSSIHDTSKVSSGTNTSATHSPIQPATTAPTPTRARTGLDSEEDEPLAARQRRVSGQHGSPVAKRARSASPDTPLAQRRKSMQDTPTRSRRSSLVTQNKPREYTVNAFASGNFVYSPVRTKAVDTGGQTNMDVDERDGSPAILLSSLSRAPASGRPKGPVRTVEDMGLDSEPFTDEELQRLPIFRSSANLVFAHGKPPGDAAPLTFPFELEKADYDACLSWSKQNDHNQLASDLTSLKCVSLSCYHIEECSRKLLSFSNPKPQDIFAGKPNDFPSHLSVYLRIEGQDPPEFAVTWAHLLENRHDQLVDLSKKVRLGTNKIELYAGRPDVDYSQYVFVLRLHSPTPRQAAWWWDRKREQVSWQRTLRRFSHFEMSSIDLSQRAKHTEHTPA